jgi:hypothetical protein
MSSATPPAVDFGDVHVLNRTRVSVAATVRDMAARGIGHTLLLHWTAGAWSETRVPWSLTRLGAVEEDGTLKILGLGLHGRILVLGPAGRGEEQVDPGSEGPAARGPLRDLRIIGGRAHVAGMKRQAYRRLGANSWARIDQGTVLPPDAKGVEGFNSIDGFGPNDLYAVGFLGEIWHYDGTAWSAADSPTNIALQRVKCAGNGTVYAAGQGGVLVRGRGDAWETVNHEETEDTFWGLEWFGERLYVASSTALYVLDGDRLVLVDMGFGRPVRCAHLHANDGVLWSVGQTDMASTTDGAAWTEVRYP